MKFYKEITLLEQAEISPYLIWSKLFAQLHIGLVENKDANEKVNTGLSFPEYTYSKSGNVNLGLKLRVFAENQADLEKLDLESRLISLKDYLIITPICAVPENIEGYATYSRKRVASNADLRRLARHRSEIDGISYEEALVKYGDLVKTSDLPYIQMLSLSTSTKQNKNNFRLRIEKKTATKSETQVFSTYGLSSESSVPEF